VSSDLLSYGNDYEDEEESDGEEEEEQEGRDKNVMMR